MADSPLFVDTMLVPVQQTDGLGRTGQVDMLPVGEPLPEGGGLSDVVAQPPSYDAPPLPNISPPIYEQPVKYVVDYEKAGDSLDVVVKEVLPDGTASVVKNYGEVSSSVDKEGEARKFAESLTRSWFNKNKDAIFVIDQSLPRDQQLGAITRSQWQLFEQQGRPLENWLFDTTAEPVSASLRSAAAQDAAEQLRIARSGVERRLQRFNMGLTEEQRLAAESGLNADVGLAKAMAANAAVKSRMDANDKLLNDLYALGRGVASGGSSALGAADSLETSREIQFNNAMADYEARKQGMIGQGLGLGAALLLA